MKRKTKNNNYIIHLYRHSLKINYLINAVFKKGICLFVVFVLYKRLTRDFNRKKKIKKLGSAFF